MNTSRTVPTPGFFAPAIEATGRLIVPIVSLYEVFKPVHQQRDERSALQAAALMLVGRVVGLDAPIALAAVRVSLNHRLPMADSVILATARYYGATLWSQDSDFSGIAGVKYVLRRSPN